MRFKKSGVPHAGAGWREPIGIFLAVEGRPAPVWSLQGMGMPNLPCPGCGRAAFVNQAGETR